MIVAIVINTLTLAIPHQPLSRTAEVSYAQAVGLDWHRRIYCYRSAVALRYIVRTKCGEEQFDVFSFLDNTMKIGSKVIQLGGGEARFADGFMNWYENDKRAHRDLPGDELPQDGISKYLDQFLINFAHPIY